MKIRTFIATASLVASGSLVAFSGSAQAALYTTCVGDGGAVTVSNDLVVPAGKSCTLTGTKVRGTVTVEAGADLVAAGATFNSSVTVAENAYLDLTDTTVKGTLTTDSAFGAHLERSTLKAVDADEGFVYVVDSTLGGAVSTEAGELYVSGSTLNSSLTGEGNQYSDVYDTTVKGALTVNGNTLGGVFCASEVYGAAAYTGNADNLQIGGQGLLGSCTGASYFGGNLAVTDNTAKSVLDNAIVRGGLTATGNDPVLVVGESARVRGAVTGETAAGASSSRSAREAAPQDRGADLAEKAAARSAAAVADAHAAGASRL
ncbi:MULTISPECIES: hypothetical protein [Streptomyces]|uniref:Uncharacterized protein n=1 Tax=Streptomyces glycanivorans TaxID=3033808 RepID=A0ABY9JLU1_9ACTN|nr:MULTISPECIES: hypothetical protein [unclassified Streptomyces]WSQ81435.1 hypothetical protein OG725_31960 [Streptomyces sp. NBC_01213]TXS10047.1 hypothetical protein EAO68_24650 [Streptomyces sp. wa22]WLQ68080.1 hypothetical protein P8A20_32940 [Streptomyces sp. Alt3]WSQ88762.1 hypothetical protein OG722_32360 [Streptomyces sp. NBC_01212]WSR05233.1 hypothetical protein OG265_04145 [Streptomyces sp. NBC_01208]